MAEKPKADLTLDTAQIDDAVKRHERRALDDLESAELLLGLRRTDGAADRAYFAAFHAGRAVVAKFGGINPKSIRTAARFRSLFTLHAVRANRVPRDVAQRFRAIEATRNVADYGTRIVEFAEAEAAVSEARAFVAACRKAIQEHQP